MKRPEISFSREVSLMFIVAVVILLLIGAMVYRNFERQETSNWWLNHTYVVLKQAETILIDISNLEADARSYVITQDKSDLQSFNKLKQKTLIDFNRFKHATADNQNRRKNSERLSAKIAHRLDMLHMLIWAVDSPMNPQQRLDKEKAIVRQGRHIKDQLQQEMDQIELGENELLAKRSADMKDVTAQTRLSFNVGLAVAIILLFLCFLLINREGLRRKKAEEEQVLLNETLEKQVERLRLEVEEREKAELQIVDLNHKLQAQVENLDTLNHNLTAVNKELEAFSYSVSHDLRAPLRSIDGFSQALLDFYNEKLDEDGRDYLNRIRNNSQRMAQLIDDMLQLSRLTRSELIIESVNLSKIATDLAEELQRHDPTRVANFVIAPNLVVQGDKSLLYALLQNLFANAWKFTSKHTQTNILFDAYQDPQRPKNQQTVYYVKDDGAGFEMEFVHKLFSAFQRLHGMAEFSGTGIGLATCQRIVHRHGGQIWAEASVENGATFFFTITG
jgi:signal transduction histidine kinase